MRVEELLGGDFDSEALLGQSLKYPESNGSALLRERIALFYPGARTENVLVTTGCSEANYTTLWSLLEKSGRAAVMLPNYLQSWGLARGYAGRVDAYRLVETRERSGRRWALDVESLERAVTKKTRVVMVTNPNNPTGAVLTEAEMDAIVRAARRVGAWIVSDEVYRGAELASDTPSPTFWGRAARVIVTGGLSKAFGLPGLRIGWIIAPPKTTERLWAYQDYTTLTPTMLSDRLARAALEPEAARSDSRAHSGDPAPAAAPRRAMDREPRGPARTRVAGRRGDRPHPVSLPHRIGRALRPAEARKVRPRDAGRPFRGRTLRSDRLRLRSGQDAPGSAKGGRAPGNAVPPAVSHFPAGRRRRLLSGLRVGRQFRNGPEHRIDWRGVIPEPPSVTGRTAPF